MAKPPRRPRRLALLLVLLLVPMAVGGIAAPANAVRTTFTQGGGISIADPIFAANTTSITIPSSGQASVYPSSINVPEGGFVTDVDVQLYSLDHAFPDDVDILLVGPGGQQVTLMSDAGGSTTVTAAELNLDDEAATALPDDAAIVSGNFRPANYAPLADTYAAPAPTSTGATALSVFDGTDPQGNWQLFVVDDVGGISGDISGGWSLDIEVRSIPYPSQLSVSGLATRVTDINVTLGGLTHTYPEDIDVLLVGPAGQQATLMSDAGGSFNVSGVNVTLDDEATAPLTGAQITSGSFRPTNLAPVVDVFPPPAPVSTGATSLGAFDGTDPNGTWRLFVVDDAGVDLGTLSSWSLDIETDNTAPTGTVSINNGAATASQAAVTLNVSATDPGTPSTGLTQMRFSNDGTNFSAFQPYATTSAWTLSAGNGIKTVFAQFRDASGNVSASVSDTITLNIVAPDTVGPKATKVKPAKNAKGVKTSAKIKVVANEALAAGSVSKKTVYLQKKGSSKKVKATVSYNAGKTTIQLKPKSALAGGSTYKVTVTSKVTDVAGNGWDEKSKSGAQPLKWSFKTK